MAKSKKKQAKSDNLVYFAVIRYIFVLILILTNFLALFLPFITIQTSYFIINLFTEATLNNDMIAFQDQIIKIVPACVAISAYYFLIILNFSVPMPIKKRILSLTYSFLALFFINILRIVVFSYILTLSKDLFHTIHFIFWLVLSSLIVILIWFSEVKLFKIKQIPIYTDIKLFIKTIKK
jgi:exosortase/archaeosortase family protein